MKQAIIDKEKFREYANNHNITVLERGCFNPRKHYLHDISANTNYPVYIQYDNIAKRTEIVSQFSIIKLPEDCSYFFSGIKTLKAINLYGLTTSSVKSMKGFFKDCINLETLNLIGFNISKVTDMSEMFSGCIGLHGKHYFGFEASSVTNISNMFSGCSNIEEVRFSTYFITDHVTDTSNMFSFCKNLKNIYFYSFNISNVKTTEAMFMYCENLTELVVPKLDMDNVIDADLMFYKCKSLKYDNIVNIHCNQLLINYKSSVIL